MDDIKRQRLDQKNARRRQRRAEKAEDLRQAEARKLVADAEQRAAAVLTEAQEESQRLQIAVQERSQLVAKLEEKARVLGELIASREASIKALEQELQPLKDSALSSMPGDRGVHCKNSEMTTNELISILEKRRVKRAKDAARQRKAYWAKRGIQVPHLESGGHVDPSRSLRRASAISQELVDIFTKKTKTFDVQSRRLVLEMFWSHPLVRRLNPSSLSSKSEKSVAASVQQMTKVLQTVRIRRAQRKDHLATSQSRH